MSLSTFDTTRASRTQNELRALVQAIHQSPTQTQETNWLEWKCSDPSTTDGLTAVARTILGFSNRAVAVAQLACDGLAYMIVGVEPQSAPGVPVTDLAKLSQKLKSYVSGPRWTPYYVDYSGVTVLVIVVEAPRPGDRIFCLLKEFTKGATSYKRGTVFHRGTAETDQAGPSEIDMLAERFAASAVATDLARIAATQQASMEADESKQARAIGIVASPVTGGRQGWRVGNNSDLPVTAVKVRTTNGAKVRVYHGRGPEDYEEYEEAVIAAQSSSQMMFRPADSDALLTDPSEAGRLAVELDDASGKRWERVGSQTRRLDAE
jgi:hypothetical protein